MKNLSSRTPASNEIFYTSADGNIVKPKRLKVFGANIVSNTYKNGQGVIVFDAPVTEIGGYAFSYCRSLTSVTIPDSVTEIGDWAFRGCSSLKSVTIPDSVTEIGQSAFSGCSSLESFYGKFASSDNRCLIIDGVLNSFAPANLTSYTIPDSVIEIGCGAFDGCSSLTSVTIPDSVTSIGGFAFENCTSLPVENNVRYAGNCAVGVTDKTLTSYTLKEGTRCLVSAFYDCSSLTSVTIPDSVTEIGCAAFSWCGSLTSVYCKPTTPPAGGYGMFYNNASGRKIYVPAASVDAYKSAKGWSEYASDIVGYDF